MKKKIWIILAVGVLVAVIVFVNHRANENEEKLLQEQNLADGQTEATAEWTQNEGEYFETFRQEREEMRDKELEYLETIIQFEDTDAETLAQAQKQKLDIVEQMEAEFTVEKMLNAKGFEKAAVTFHQGAVNVVLENADLTQAQVAQVLDIVISETGVHAENVKIVSI